MPNKELKYKVVAEYDRYYVAESAKKYKECFFKDEYRPNENGYIIQEKREFEARELLPPEKINKAWNGHFNYRKRMNRRLEF